MKITLPVRILRFGFALCLFSANAPCAEELPAARITVENTAQTASLARQVDTAPTETGESPPPEPGPVRLTQASGSDTETRNPRNRQASDDCLKNTKDLGKTADDFARAPLIGETTASTSMISAGLMIILCTPTAITEGSFAGDEVAYFQRRQLLLATISRDRLAIDFAGGGGEYASALAWLHGCPPRIHRRHAGLARQHFADIYRAGEVDPEQELARLETWLARDPVIAAECTRVS